VLHRLYLAGAEVLAAALARRLRDRYDFAFLCLDEIGPLGKELAHEGFVVVDLARRPGVDWSVARRLRRAVGEHHIRLLHAHQYTPFFYAAASRGLGRRPRILFTEHGRHYPDSRRPKRVLANRFLLKRSDRVTAVGRFVKGLVAANEGIAADRIEVVHNGIDPARFDPRHLANMRAEARGELDLSDRNVLVMQVARFHPVKDHATGLRAFAHALRHGATQAVLGLVGDGEKRDEMEALAGELEIAAHVRFLGVRSDIPRLMAGADLFMLSSLSEGISVTLLEAMAASLPIVATDVGGNSEVLERDVTGLLSPRGDAEALGHNLRTLIESGELRRRMGQAGRERLLQQFTEQRMHERFTRLYREMLGG